MAGSSLLALIDDIATVLDDVAALSKVAAKKTAGVLGDDLALNAQQVSGVNADRELPVVWAVAKGSFINKFILVPAALLISAFAPVLITVLLVIGGLFLCFEGAEKVVEKFFHSTKKQAKVTSSKETKPDETDLSALEKEKIKGAIRTDFILSAEIVVIALGSVQAEPFETQVMVVSSLALAITFGVYGLVAALVKIDDLGLYLLRKSLTGNFNYFQRLTGRGLLIFAPLMMKTLALVGTIAMFLVGGGILTHSFSWLHHVAITLTQQVALTFGSIVETISLVLFDGFAGLLAGLLVLICVDSVMKLKHRLTS